MYIKIPMNLLENNPFNSVGETLFYAFCASHVTPDKGDEMSFNYTTAGLQEVFPISSAQLTRYLTSLVSKGFAENNSYYIPGEEKYITKRNYKIKTDFYWESFEINDDWDYVNYLNVNLEWITNYGMSFSTALILACVYSGFIYLKKPKDIYFKTVDIMRMTGIKDRRTVWKAIDQLTVLGFITEKVSDRRYFRLIELNEKKCLCKSIDEAKGIWKELNSNIINIVKDKKQRFVDSIKSYLKKASVTLGNTYREAYEAIVGCLPEYLEFKPLFKGRLIM